MHKEIIVEKGNLVGTRDWGSLWSLPWGEHHPSGPRETCRGSPGRVQRCVPAATSVQCVGDNSPGRRWFQTKGDKTFQAGTSQFLPRKSGKPGLLVSSISLAWPPSLYSPGPCISISFLPPPLPLEMSPQFAVWPWLRSQHAWSSQHISHTS